MEGLNKDKGKSVPITRWKVYDGYKRVKSSSGGAGVDKMTIVQLDGDLENLLYKLWNRLSSGSYFPPEVRRAYIPKGKKGYRPLGIPTVLDRIAQSVLKDYCEPRLEAIFSERSYGFRPGRSAHDALKQVRTNCWRYDWVIDMDIKGYFDMISHDLLLKAVEKHFSEKWVRLYISRWLKAGILHADGTREGRQSGTPQGGVISPLLSNLFLHYVFDRWMEIHHSGQDFVRYADDIIVHCKTETEAEGLLEQIKERLKACGLEIHPEKTKIVYCKDSKRRENSDRPQKFTFLGYDFKPRKKWNRTNKSSFTGFDLGISHHSKMRIRQIVSRCLKKGLMSSRIEDIAKQLDPKIRGWYMYYGKFNPNALGTIWNWLNYKLVRWLLRRMKRFKLGSRSANKWFRQLYERDSNLFFHWTIGQTPG